MAAREASLPLNQQLPFTDIKLAIAKILAEKWQEQWNIQTGNKLYNIKPIIGLWPSLKQRHSDVLLTRLRIGHTRITHRHLLFGENTPICTLCRPLTVSHIFISCIAYTHLYPILFGCSSPSVKDLFGISPHHAIFNFLKIIGKHHHI